MNSYELVEAAVADATVEDSLQSSLRRAGMLALLRDASITIDSLWHAAQRGGSLCAVAELGEASLSLHRAVAALSDSEELEAAFRGRTS